MNSELYCGACGSSFVTRDCLFSHLDNCIVAKILLPMSHIVMFGGDKVGHPIAGLIVGIKKSVPLIHKYAMAVANDINTFRRAEIHRELCLSLGVSRDQFKPFENDSIKKVGKVKKQTLIKPIFDWKEWHIWDFIDERNLPYPSLYDEGWDRIGCKELSIYLLRESSPISQESCKVAWNLQSNGSCCKEVV